ncbi:Phosphoglycerate mutase domain protein [Rhodopirellula maiorica SM1]|uniref:Phosphoglycerate mutase domain protein n=1 Tax=Rhodopirellula maiorica SM1 TaxID=1265738 RepID=M5S0F2_9BACT|nr:histidine phosphatase family protein [Rhodopirellula maiorica]EMI19644.1 Phosphoglycerate mutase domain protein [Rhodopirellula maiorica SM1]
MQLYLIRHAESENNAMPAYQRIEDPAITSRGRLQSEYLAKWTSTLTIDTLITSPFRRSIQTTRFIVDQSPQRVHVWHNVFERGGCFRGHGPDATEGGPGMGRESIEKEFSALPHDCIIDETITSAGWWAGNRRETDDQAHTRAGVVIERLIQSFGASGKTIVAVIHADFKRCLLAKMLSDVTDVEKMGALVNTGITRLEYDGHAWKLHWLNSATHLPSRLVTGNET